MSTHEFNAVDTGSGGVGATTPSAWSRLGNATIVEGTPTSYAPQPVAAPRTRDVAMLIVSAPAVALTAFAFAVAQLLGDVVSAPLATLIPDAANSPANHVRVIALIHLGMAGIGIALGAAALLRCRLALPDGTMRSGRDACPRWAGWLAGAAPAICALVAFQSVLLLILSALAPPGASG